MAGNYLNIKINIEKEDICFTKDKNRASSPFDIDYNDSSANNIRVELGIAKVFHKVLNLIKDNKDLFQKEDFELLGEMLGKILFGKINNDKDVRNFIMKEVEQTLDITKASNNKICRIFLEFDQKSGVAMLPWEYTLYKTRSMKDAKSIYLSASVKSRFHLIRRVKENNSVFPDADKLFMIVLLNVDGNKDSIPQIDSRTSDLPKIKTTFKNLQNKFPDSLVIEFIESTPFNQIKQEVENIYKKWEKQYGEINYVLHYVGHSMLDNQIGKLVIKNAESGKPDWVEDKKFASIFSEEKLNIKQPVMVCFQACDSAKIGSYNENLRGVAYEFTQINIPAVIGMQNEIDTPYSNAFFEHFYQEILNGNDVADAVTSGRDYLGRDFKIEEDAYTNNSFGSPVLFITTEEPIQILKSKESEAAEKEKTLKTTESFESIKSFSEINRAEQRQSESEYAGVSGAAIINERDELNRSAVKSVQGEKAATPSNSSNPNEI